MQTQKMMTRRVAGLVCLMAALLPCKAADTASKPYAATHPIVDIENGYLLGGSAGGKWVSDTAAAKPLRGGEMYRIYGATRALGTARGGKPQGQGAPCPETRFVEFTPKPAPEARIAVAGTWNALPRAPKILPTTSPVYREVVRKELAQHGLTKPTVKIDQIWRVDLDGDGRDEILISANNYAYDTQGASPPSASQAGDYSLLLVRHIVSGQVRTFVLGGEYYTRAKTFNAPNDAHIAAVLDVNGDGKMEIIVHSRYYEGSGTNVFQMSANGFQSVLSSGCGA